jgi:mono/diheme cytochrome c family protein
MLRGLLIAIVAALLVIFSLGTVRQGLNDAWNSLTHLNYYEIRDMRRSVVFVPQHRGMYAPAPGTVPTVGADHTYGLEGIELATKLGETLVNPTAPDDSSIARGHRKFLKNCIPCHGISMAGDGPVAPMFMAPPDLLAEATRNRKDGYIFSYMRHGGVVMPSYGAAVTAEEAWDVVNYIRSMQKKSPR